MQWSIRFDIRFASSRPAGIECQIRSTGAPSACGALEIGGADFRARKQVRPAALESDFAIDQDITAMRDLERLIGVLFNQEDRQLVLFVEEPDGGKYLLHQKRRQPKRRLVEKN